MTNHFFKNSIFFKNFIFKNLGTGIALSVAMILATPLAVSAETVFKFSPEQGKVSFLAIGRPSAIKIHGEGKGPEGTLSEKQNKVSGSLKFAIASLSTGIDMRDHHMKEKYLESDKFPTAELKITNLNVTPNSEIKDQPFSGTMTIKGVEKPITGKYSANIDGKKEKITASFPIKLTDFKIEIPTYLGIKVAEDVTVDISSTSDREAK